jgi:dihydrofolate reductase
MKLHLIAAVSIDGAIGHDDKLLWHIPEDLKRFKEKTIGNICIVGFNTYNSLPEFAFENREYIVVSNNETDIKISAKALCYKSVKEAINKSKEMVKLLHKKIYIVGGEQIYNSAIDSCDIAEITWINKIYPEANKRFPLQKLFDNFEEVSDSNWHKSESGILYKFCEYKRS